MTRLDKDPTSTPMQSVRHDVLYSKARYVLNQRHIKRPFFNLNPFLERTDESVDLENFLPEESKYIQPLESLVLCESYRSEQPVDTRELTVDRFFDYLYSDLWATGATGGCALRVLDGQLLDQLLTFLYRMEKQGTIVRHTTHAFARNKKPRTGCYKLANKTEYGCIEDSLMIELAYFGRLVKDSPNPKHQNPLEYLRLGMPEFTDDSPPLAPSPPLDDIPKRKRAFNTSVDVRSINSKLPEVNLDLAKTDRAGRKYLLTRQVNSIRCIQGMKPKSQRSSGVDVVTSSGTPMSFLQGYSNDKRIGSMAEDKRSPGYPLSALQGYSNDKRIGSMSVEKRSNNVRHVDNRPDPNDPKQLLKKFPVQKVLKSTSSMSVDDDEKAEKSESNEEEAYFGYEFYLADERVSLNTKQDTVKDKLKKNKIELQERRQEAKEILASQKKIIDRSVLPPLPELEAEQLHSTGAIHCTIRMPEEMPTFEEFIQLLKEDAYYDPRYRNKIRLKRKIIARRYYIAKGMRMESVIFEDYGPGSRLDSSHQVVPRDRRTSNVSDYGSRTKLRLSTLQESSQGLSKMPRLPDIRKTGSGSTQQLPFDPADIADEVLGVTDSEPCKDHCLAVSRSLNKSHEDKTAARQHDNSGTLPKKSVTNTSRQPGNRRSKMELQTVSPSTQERSIKRPMLPLVTKASLADWDTEDPESDSDPEESDTDEETFSSQFDATKLNKTYSSERLRKKQRRKKKKPVMVNILAKFYNMRNAITTSRRGSTTTEIKSSKTTTKPERLSLAGFFRGAGQGLKPTKKTKLVVGKMRKFDFLETKPKRPMDLDKLPRADFSSPCLGAFLGRLEGALEDFVVRREIVVSDLPTYYKSATSVTFTRKSCFANKHKNC